MTQVQTQIVNPPLYFSGSVGRLNQFFYQEIFNMETQHAVAYPAFRTHQVRVPSPPEDRMVTVTGYHVVRITTADTERVIDFLNKFFFHDEPLNICVDLLQEPGERCQELENYCRDTIPDGYSCMAVSGDDEIVGVCLSGLLEREETIRSAAEPLPPCSHPRFIKILHLLTNVGRESNVFGQFPEVDKVVDLRVLSVSDAWRGRGIAKELIQATKVMAKEGGIKMVRVDCTSHFSALAVAKLGFHCIYQLNYADYLSEDGTPVFEPEPPHCCVKTCVAQI